MSTAAVPSSIPSLASIVRASAAQAVADRPVCLWCGSRDVALRKAGEWPHELELSCRACGSETSYDRRLARRRGG